MKWDRKTVILLVLLALYALLFAPIWQPVLLGFLFASACAPPLRKLQSILKSRRSPLAYATAFVSMAVFFLIFAYLGIRTYSFLLKLSETPDTFAHLSDQAFYVKQKVTDWLVSKGFWTAEEVSEHLNRVFISGTIASRDFLVRASRNFVTQAPQVLLALVIFFLSFCAFLIGGTRIVPALAQKFHWGDMKAGQAKFENICALSLGSVILTAFLQASLVVVGAAIVGIPSLFLVFLVTFICSMIPVVGAAAIPLALTLFQFANGETSNAVVLIVTAAIAGTADNVLKAYLFSRAAKTNPLISLMALIGGLALFGFPGLFIAPVVEQLLMASIDEK